VTGVFHTSRRHDVQDLAVSPPPAAQPAVLLMGGSVWLAGAVGPAVYVWESAGLPKEGRPEAALATWELRATLRHSSFFSASHHAVWSVRLGDGPPPGKSDERRAVTVGEDGIFRAWHFGGEAGLEGQVMWQHSIGDARQVVVALLGSAGCFAAIARADQRSLQLFQADTGHLLETIHNVWPAGARSLPQSAAYDTCSQVAMFSSISESGDGALALVDLAESPCLTRLKTGSREMPHMSSEVRESSPRSVAHSSEGGAHASPPGPMIDSREAVSPCSAHSARVAQVEGPLAGPGRVLRLALAVPAAGVVVAVVHEGDPSVLLEVWDKTAALESGRAGCARFRGRVPPFLSNPRLVAAGGRRLVLLDPAALRNRGDLRILEWRPAASERQLGPGGTSEAASDSPRSPLRRRVSTRLLSWYESSPPVPRTPPCCGCVAGLRRFVKDMFGARSGRRSDSS